MEKSLYNARRATEETVCDFLSTTRSRHLKILKSHFTNIQVLNSEEVDNSQSLIEEKDEPPNSCEDCQYNRSSLVCEYIENLKSCVLRLPKKWEEYFFMDGTVKPIIIVKD